MDTTTYALITDVAGRHTYLSTACLHARHDYCNAMIGYQGLKRPAQCKFCDAVCVCECHQQRPESPPPSAVWDRMTKDEDLARLAYAAYGNAVDHKNYLGKPIPAYEDLGQTIQNAWKVAARAVATSAARYAMAYKVTDQEQTGP